jgi:phage baseplate assembly protein W
MIISNRIQINPASGARPATVKSAQFYKGFSTQDDTTRNVKLYDYDLIKQDLINNFNTRRGERLMNPTYGTLIWAAIFEPLTPAIKQQIADDVNNILAADPRVHPIQVNLVQTEYGFSIDVVLQYVGTDVSDTMQLTFDRNAGISV